MKQARGSFVISAARHDTSSRGRFEIMTTTRTGRPARISAWLVSWEHMRDHATPPDIVAAVLSPSLTARGVLEIVELLYANASYDPSERIAFAKSRRGNPYPARFGVLHGLPWEGEIVCGNNPWLERARWPRPWPEESATRRLRPAAARPRSRADRDATGQERFVWDERQKPCDQLLATLQCT